MPFCVDCPPIATRNGDVSDLRQLLLSRVMDVFPELAVATTRLESSGGDHLLLIADERYVFRFPRQGHHALAREIHVLKRLSEETYVPVPSYEYVDPAGCFAGYRFINGRALAPTDFGRLDTALQTIILAGIVSLLRALHGLDMSAEDSPNVSWSSSWTAADFSRRALSDRLPTLAAQVPAIAPAAQTFMEAYAHDSPRRTAIIHGDLVPEHILIDYQAGELSGVIDFGDVALGDPAHDLAGLWAYGTRAAVDACRLYDIEQYDPLLVSRSRNHFIRYRIDRLFEQFADGADYSVVEQEVAELGDLLAVPSTSYQL